MAVAATAMGLFNWAQIESLRGELFQQKKATWRLFEVVQDFSQNFVGIQNSVNEIRSLLFSLVMANLTLLDARLSRIENQLLDRLRRVTCHPVSRASKVCRGLPEPSLDVRIVQEPGGASQ
jgi:hypothetical protein